ncbi:MAG: GNAT family N-acyltransferase [Rhodoferax sp.]
MTVGVASAKMGSVGLRMSVFGSQAAKREPLYTVAWAVSPAEVREAQQLRHRVFSEEMGASLPPDASGDVGIDCDRFDPFCAHLIVRATGRGQSGQVVATCRVLTPDAVHQVGAFYAQSEFDLYPVRDLLPSTLEMGRVCVHPDWRSGLIVMAMWRAVGQKLAALKLDCIIGCSSVSVKDGGGFAVQLWNQLQATHLAPANRQIVPHIPFGLPQKLAAAVATPPLIAGYLRCGGKVLGPPAFDAVFETADFPMMLNLADMPARYNKRIFGDGH